MTAERYDEATVLDKFIMLSYPIIHVGIFISFLTYAITHKADFPLPVIMQLLAYCLTSSTYSAGFYSFHMTRGLSGKIVKIVNDKNTAILNRPNAEKYQTISNRIYFVVAWLAIIWTVSGISSSLPIVIGMLTTGEIFYKTPFPIKEQGWQAFTQNTIHSVVVAQLAQFYTFFWCIFIEIYLRIAWFFRVLADDLRGLRKSANTREVVDEVAEEAKFKLLINEYQELKEVVTIANEILSVYMNAFVTLVYTTMGMIIALVASLDSAWEGVQFIFFPLYQYMILATFCYLGQHVMDAGDACQEAIYECEWTSAPNRFKVMVQLFIHRCVIPITVDAKPFYELNFTLLTKVKVVWLDEFSVNNFYLIADHQNVFYSNRHH